ncbi:DUF503 domain-containing protein [Desulfurella sp.]|uniref:DUF503 domain-containing protein n=1 Tax=Desulfurella sp. TaxID=1962857 RepID=UPI003D1126FD
MIVDLLIKDAMNIKDRRNVLASIIQKLRSNFNVSVADVSKELLYNKATLAITTIANKKNVVENFLDKISNFISKNYSIEILNIERQIL